jgi:hypothetical protein
MGSHIIVYLDQNYLSNMAKAGLGYLETEDDTNFWHSLFDDLKKAVLADKIACPELEFHRTESAFDSRLENPILETIYKLSLGLRFHPWRSIVESQIEVAAIKYLGKPVGEEEPWAIAFESDPQAPAKSRNVAAIILGLSTLDEVQLERKRKIEFKYEAQKLLKKYSNSRLGWRDLLLQSKRSCLDGLLGRTACLSIIQEAQTDSFESQFSALNKFYRLRNLFGRLRDIGIDVDSPKVMDFMESEELLNTPFVDVNASFWAAIGRAYRGEERPKGDLYDVPILASALPYCDIVTTDKSMKEILVNILHFDDKYKATIFSATKQDRLAFQKFIRGL